MMRLINICTAALLIASSSACSEKNSADISVTDAWVRATLPGQQTGAAYLSITSTKPAALIKVESPAAKHAEIHSMEMKDGIMIMREMEALPLPEKQTVQLAPGGNHIMLMNLEQPLKAGEKVPLKLSFKLGNQTIEMDVEANVRKN